MSTFTSGAPDLDLRPAPLAREAHKYLVEICDTCGFPGFADEDPADPVVAAAITGFESIDADEDYLPEGVAALELRARIERAASNFDSAGGLFLRAAWSADDLEDEHLAKALRLKAIESWDRAAQSGDLPAEDEASSRLLLTDVLRRAQEKQRATTEARSGLEKDPEPMLRALLDFELELIGRGDTECHSIGDVTRP